MCCCSAPSRRRGCRCTSRSEPRNPRSQRLGAGGRGHQRMIVASGRVVTAAAMMGHLDLALWLLRQASPDMAALVARLMLIDRRTSQARYVIPDFLAHADPLVERFERWARQNLAAGFSLQAAAGALAVTARTLQRRTEAVLGKSPLAFVQDLRVERAQSLIAMGLDLEAIAAEVGYADATTLRNLLRRRLGRGVRELRAEMQPHPREREHTLPA
ncbi:helix-turn-helix domain-containing protein [Roseomonas hellenica]|nr:helix-turn-helix domain-containing protein [Plastoroseomonas hellenica]